jgi:hypothetical protein
MQEQYYGGNRKRRLSPWELEQMRRQMKKVPEIQQKAEQYQKKEEETIEKQFEQHLQHRTT